MALSRASVLARARNIRLIGMDIDGVLTAGEVVVLDSGEEIKFWNAKDRLVLAAARDARLPVAFAWITGRRSRAVARTAKDLGIQHVVQKCHDKGAAFEAILAERGLRPEQAAFIGDDLIDLPALRRAGLSCSPSDAVRDVLERVHYVAPVPGGRGVLRDVLELVLRAQGKWDALLRPFLS